MEEIIDLFNSEEEFGVDAEREIAEQYELLMKDLEEKADRFFYELGLEM